MDNYSIADNFSLLSKIMDIHGENSFKSKTYSVAAFNIEKLPLQLAETSKEQIFLIKGIGDSVGKKVIEMLETGKLNALQEYLEKTPPGIVEMLNIKGIGPKKINTIWKEMEIESVGELLYACQENRLKLYKGFGEKSQQSIIDTIEFYLKNKESHLYHQTEKVAQQALAFFKKTFGEEAVFLSGSFKRQLEIVDEIEYVIAEPVNEIEKKIGTVPGFILHDKNEENISFK